jgi:hypothetical protein
MSSKKYAFFSFCSFLQLPVYPQNVMYIKTHADIRRLEAIHSNLEWHLNSIVPKFAERDNVECM